MNKQWYVIEINGFSEEEAQEFFNNILKDVKWGNKQSMGISHLTNKGVSDLKKHVFKKDHQ